MTAIDQYSDLFNRTEEFARLKEAVLDRKRPMLVYGEEGSGKTLLLQQFLVTSKKALYVPHCDSPTDLLGGIITAMERASVPKSELKMSRASLPSMKGVVQRVLDNDNWILVLDHVQGPSVALGHLVKELNYYNRTPIVFAGRSEHMEDIGSFRTFCTDRSSRLELKPWPLTAALEFTRRHATEIGLSAANLEEALRGIAEMSKGYPGPILTMLRMAKEPAYRHDDQIKFHVVWLDYRLRGTGAISRNVKPATGH